MNLLRRKLIEIGQFVFEGDTVLLEVVMDMAADMRSVARYLPSFPRGQEFTEQMLDHDPKMAETAAKFLLHAALFYVEERGMITQERIRTFHERLGPMPFTEH